MTAPLARLLEEDDNAIVYSCGPDGMLHAVSDVSQAAGVPCQLALEAPAWTCGMGTCKGCAVMGTDGTYKYVCYDGPVFEAADIFEAASRACPAPAGAAGRADPRQPLYQCLRHLRLRRWSTRTLSTSLASAVSA